MKINFPAILAGATLLLAGCARTVSDTHTFASTWSKDTIPARYNRSCDQVYRAGVAVIQNNNGVILKEFIIPGTNVVRSLEGKLEEKNVWLRVMAVDPQTSQVDVQVRSSWGVSDVQMASELSTQIALQLQTAR